VRQIPHGEPLTPPYVRASYTAVRHISVKPLFSPVLPLFPLQVAGKLKHLNLQYVLERCNVQPFAGSLRPLPICWQLVSPVTMASADFLVYRNTESSPRPTLVIALSFAYSCRIYLSDLLVFFGLYNVVFAYPIKHA